MLMARPVPLQYTEDEAGNGGIVAREGYVNLTLIPRRSVADEDTTSGGSFDKEGKISVKLRSKQIGQIISWKGFKNSFIVNGVYGSVGGSGGYGQMTMEFRPLPGPSNEESMIELCLVPKFDASTVAVPISVGELRSFQILLESVIPSLYGWGSPATKPVKSLSGEGRTKSPEEFFKQFQ
jgi:hypothetical protein